MEASGFVTVVRDRLARDGGIAPREMLQRDVKRVVVDGFDHRRDEELANLQYEVTELRRELREEMQRLRTDMAFQLAERSADSLKWAMLFWVGQAVAVAGVVSALR
jgi:hypothetical protein